MEKDMLKRYRFCRRRIEIGRGSKNDYATVDAVTAFIAAIPDALTREIFRERYIHGCSWAQVAFAVNNTPDACRMIANRYLKAQKS